MDPANLTNIAVQLTAEQISEAMQDRILSLLVSIGLTMLGGVTGANIKNDVGKTISFILASLGAVGTIGFTVALINLSTQMF